MVGWGPYETLPNTSNLHIRGIQCLTLEVPDKSTVVDNIWEELLTILLMEVLKIEVPHIFV